jgi:hypothetical protein
MTREQLEHAIRAAGAISGDPELYVVGSQAILGACPDAHAELLRSLEVDIAPSSLDSARKSQLQKLVARLTP